MVHGRCPTGIDRYTAQWCEAWVPMAGFLGRDVIEEPHPAAWNIHGKAAGPLRNQEMVDLGADVCLGYPIELQAKASGTRDCMRRAQRAGIETWDRSSTLTTA